MNSKRCENPTCEHALGWDHVTLTTTVHVRRFCTVECLVESFHAHRAHLAGLTEPPR